MTTPIMMASAYCHDLTLPTSEYRATRISGAHGSSAAPLKSVHGSQNNKQLSALLRQLILRPLVISISQALNSSSLVCRCLKWSAPPAVPSLQWPRTQSERDQRQITRGIDIGSWRLNLRMPYQAGYSNILGIVSLPSSDVPWSLTYAYI